MRYVYAHFPINVTIDENKESGLFEVEIRNFLGEKIVRKVIMHEGVEVETSKGQKDELTITGNSLENVSQSAADVQQICRVRNKDIRKVCGILSPLLAYQEWLLTILVFSSWMVCMFRNEATFSTRSHVDEFVLFCHYTLHEIRVFTDSGKLAGGSRKMACWLYYHKRSEITPDQIEFFYGFQMQHTVFRLN